MQGNRECSSLELRGSRGRLPSIQRRILASITVVLLVLTATLTATCGYLVYRRIYANLHDVLNTALNVAWQEYTSRPRHVLTTMRYLVSLPDFQSALDSAEAPRVKEYLHLLPDVDFAFLVSPQGAILAHTNPALAEREAPFFSLIREAIRQGIPQICTEELAMDTLQTQAPGTAERLRIAVHDHVANPGPFDRALLQVVVVPVNLGGQDGALVACLVLNNTYYIPQGYSQRMPNSYLSISCEGVRVCSNIRTGSGLLSPGGVQTQPLITTVARGKRYLGLVRVDPHEVHYVASDPIVDSRGRVVGALSVGLPPSGFAALQRETLVAILACAFLSFLLAVGVAGLVARRISRPTVWLDDVARRLAMATGAQEYRLALADVERKGPSLYSREMAQLYQSFSSMAHELGRKYQETVDYLERLQQDREQLQKVTAQLQEANSLLEKKVEERTRELREAVVELRQANAHKSQFLANMSHELRTPLNSVIGFAEMLTDQLVGPINAKQREYLDHILASARHLLQLISDMLDLSRIEQGRTTLDRQEVLIPDLVSSVQTIVEHQAHARGLQLHVDIPPSLPPLWADPTRVKQVLYNLLSNAIKFTPQGGQVWVRAWQEDDEIAIQVEDTGIGIKPEDQQAVFDEFVQAESAYRRRFEGVGLGLPLSKKLIELHGGRIGLESDVGRG
ncbi:MAG TPA: hypothetical protein GX513_06855, partial [Firmicutes bacterium]|nr:hypothetical protein [Bacillota bacterium]